MFSFLQLKNCLKCLRFRARVLFMWSYQKQEKNISSLSLKGLEESIWIMTLHQTAKSEWPDVSSPTALCSSSNWADTLIRLSQQLLHSERRLNSEVPHRETSPQIRSVIASWKHNYDACELFFIAPSRLACGVIDGASETDYLIALEVGHCYIHRSRN